MKRLKAYLLMAVPYVIGCALGWFVFLQIAPDSSDMLKILSGLLVADICATLVVWLFGLIFRNSSFYDPYWSLIPWLIVLGLMIRFSLLSAASILFIVVFGVWSWRLTINWAYTCKGLKTEDWRYTKFRADNKVFMWHIINLFGINLMPTLIVFSALIPAVYIVLNSGGIGIANIIGAIIILAGTALETASDVSMHRFLKKPKTDGSLKVHRTGLYKYSRHPNYLGEITVWIGVYVSALSVAAWWFAGAVAMIMLFVFVSIPLAEKRQLARRPEYAEYKSQTRMLLPLPKANVSVAIDRNEEQRESESV